MNGVCVFDYADWSATYPAFANTVNEDQATTYFKFATMYVNNSPQSMMRDDVQPGGQRETILYLVVAHIATLLGPVNSTGDPNNARFVGSLSNASEGSVSIGAQPLPATTPSQAWFMQTQWGALAWMMLAPYRTFRYRDGPRPYFGTTPIRPSPWWG